MPRNPPKWPFLNWN
ncbi:hypothetical protein F383_32420 [Gossypium arboreum]|uniref:Uncharacterized protein n=1 Tax=Gossypium arboreum TaxID=29729 RepID=A0A0B0PI76_GOSAR|nr:hypothetical protein F383_32420 [Gossypium arboreum]